jgi:5-methylcytosine-specific restriction protein A
MDVYQMLGKQLRPSKPCTKAGCCKLVNDGTSRCELHKAERVNYKRNADYTSMYTHQWKKARLVFLKQNPLCVTCMTMNRLEPATVVDHIIPHKGDKDKFWDFYNWQALCKPCHDTKTATEDGGFGNKKKVSDD